MQRNVRDPSQKGNMGASQNWDLKGMGIVLPHLLSRPTTIHGE